ncbi:hypothetical protein BC830DRAFT_284914 [Chytriomyces sp. MP71]|nr:hypothetical protein BC830DRAFT_284914 [Chytriomyces sp. MP71]
MELVSFSTNQSHPHPPTRLKRSGRVRQIYACRPKASQVPRCLSPLTCAVELLTDVIRVAFGDTWVDYPVFSSSFSRSLESKEVLELQLTPLYSLSGTKTLVAGCKSYTQEQANQTRGKMVVVVRGDCSFEEKAIHALNAGAAAVGVVNVDNHILGMVGSGGLREPLGIPVVLLQKNTWDRVQVEVGGVESLLPVKLMALDTLEEEIITGLQLQYGNRPLSNLMIVAMVQVEGN